MKGKRGAVDIRIEPLYSKENSDEYQMKKVMKPRYKNLKEIRIDVRVIYAALQALLSFDYV